MIKEINGSKAFLQKVLIYAAVVIVTLVGTVWAITWKTTHDIARRNSEAIGEIKEFMSAQAQLNKTLEKQLDEILTEVKK